MSQVIDLEQSRLLVAVKKGFRNWRTHFQESFGINTRFADISSKTIAHLAQGREKGTFYLYDLIMNLKGLGSGFEFDELRAGKKMNVIDQYLFLLDCLRFECMKRLNIIETYPGEERSLVELIINFEKLVPRLQAENPVLSRNHPGFQEYSKMTTLEKEVFVRKLIPKALEEIMDNIRS